MSVRDELSSEIKPGDDFFGYVNHKWLEAHPIPDDKARMGAFDVLTDANVETLREALERDEADAPANIALLRQYYRAAMDEVAIEAGTEAAVARLRERVGRVADARGLVEYVAELQAEGAGALWNAMVDADDKDSQRYLVRLTQGGLGLPDRDYYLENGERFETVRAEYVKFVTAVFERLGLDDAAERAAGVLALETKLAEASMTAVERRDPDAQYNMYDSAALVRDFGGVEWASYLEVLGFAAERKLNVSQPKFLAVALQLVASEPVEVWQNYLLAHGMAGLMPRLGKDYESLHFGFYGRVLRGAKEQEPRYRRIIRSLMLMLPEPLGQAYVEAKFDESAKVAIYDLVGHLQTALGKRIDALEWMGEATKAKAHAKLATFLPLLGYPDTWKNYDGLNLGTSFSDNYTATNTYEWQRWAAKVDEPLDRREWLMSPAMVNAYYWPNTNGITFPAGILQPPFFDARGDFALNYGAIGTVIGHEITHGFDDEGSKYDDSGNLNSWWSEDDRDQFETRAQRLVEQYNGYEAAGRHVNGELTLGENIADLGGLLVAFDALQTYLNEGGASCDQVDDLTPEQRFFIGFARSWREQSRPELMLQRLVGDPHSPEEFRTNGVVTNMDAWYEAFGVVAGDTLYQEPETRVRIW